MSHACDGHPCDGCDLCQLGLCCATVPPDVRVRLEAAIQQQPAPRDELRDAIVAEVETGTAPQLGELVRLEAVSQPAASLLPRPSMPLSLPEAAEPVPDNYSRKELLHVHVPDNTQ